MKSLRPLYGRLLLLSAALLVFLPVSAAAYELSASSTSALPGSTAEVEIRLASGASRVGALVFAVEYDTARLQIAIVQSSGDLGSVAFSIPPAFSATTFDVGEPGMIGIAVYDPQGPVSALPDGVLARIRFFTKPAAEGFAFVRVAPAPAPNASDPEQRLLQATMPSSASGVTIAPQRPLLAVNPSVLDFGNVPPRTAVEKTIVLSNVGSAPLDIARLQLGTGSEPFSILTPLSSPRTLHPGQSLAVTIGFRSDAQAVYTTRLFIDYAANGATSVTVPISAITSFGSERAYVRRWVVPAAAHLDASDQSAWRSSLTIFNNDSVPAGVRLALRTAMGETSFSSEILLDVHQSKTFDDVVGEAFGASNTTGVILVDASASDIEMRSTTYRLLPTGGRIAQAVPVLPWASMLHSGERGVLAGLERSERATTNLGLINFTPAEITIHADVYAADGTLIGSRDYAILSERSAQNVDLFDALGISNAAGVTVVLTTPTPDATFFAYASTTDRATGGAVFQGAR